MDGSGNEGGAPGSWGSLDPEGTSAREDPFLNNLPGLAVEYFRNSPGPAEGKENLRARSRGPVRTWIFRYLGLFHPKSFIGMMRMELDA